MVWTTPRTWSRGDFATESMLNEQVRDNLDFLYQNLGSSAGFFRGLNFGTHIDNDVAAKKVLLRSADQVALNDGSALANVANLAADITLSGAGGLDTGSEQASTWYSAHVIHKSSVGTKNLLLHREKDYFLDESYLTDDDTGAIRAATGTLTARAQGFQVDTAGFVEFIDVKLVRSGTPVGTLTLQAEIHADSAGVPSNTPLATSDKLNPVDVSTTAHWVRFIFRSPVSLSALTQYHLVLTGGWTASDTEYVGWRADVSAPSYTRGTGSSRSGASTWSAAAGLDFIFKIYVTRNDAALTMPSGYDGSCLIGYAFNNSISDLIPFDAADRRVIWKETLNAVVGGSAAVPTLLDWLGIPPRRVKVRMFGDTGGAGTLWLGPVPSGFRTPTGVRGGGAAGTSAGQSLQSLEIITETQAFYTQDTSGTYDLIADSWEW